MKRGISLIILLLCALCLQAQSDLTWIRTKEGRMVAVPKRAVFDLNLPKFTYKSFTPSDRQLIEAKLREFIPDLPVQSAYEQERPMDMIISSAAYQPFFNPYTPMLRRVSPMALDFHEVSIIPVSEQVAFITSGQQYNTHGPASVVLPGSTRNYYGHTTGSPCREALSADAISPRSILPPNSWAGSMRWPAMT